MNKNICLAAASAAMLFAANSWANDYSVKVPNKVAYLVEQGLNSDSYTVGNLQQAVLQAATKGTDQNVDKGWLFLQRTIDAPNVRWVHADTALALDGVGIFLKGNWKRLPNASNTVPMLIKNGLHFVPNGLRVHPVGAVEPINGKQLEYKQRWEVWADLKLNFRNTRPQPKLSWLQNASFRFIEYFGINSYPSKLENSVNLEIVTSMLRAVLNPKHWKK